jgi:hypothetical protein
MTKAKCPKCNPKRPAELIIRLLPLEGRTGIFCAEHDIEIGPERDEQDYQPYFADLSA